MSESQNVQNTLREIDIHESWVSAYRTPENEPFYRMAFDHLRSVYGDPKDGPVLDAGCGSSTKSIHLAKRGYRVTAIDFSEQILRRGRRSVVEQGLDGQIAHSCADLTRLPFASGTFQRVLCWGVLMHVPNVDGALAELARVTRSGGLLAISENNLHSLHSRTFRGLKTLLRRHRSEVRRTPAGMETWETSPVGPILTREADPEWLTATLREHGLEQIERRAGEFTQIFVLLRQRPLRRLVHGVNSIWFQHIRLAGPSLGNLLIFRKR